MLLFEDLPSEVRHCTWCSEPFPPTRENFSACKTGRWGLMTVCKSCQAHDARIRRQYREEHAEPAACPCGAEGPLEIDHEHRDYPYAFRAYLCRSCNLKAREPWKRGPAAKQVVATT